jgi:rRNA processing protein Gar1
MARDVVGKVVNVSAKGLLVRAPKMVRIGTPLVDVRNQPVGRVTDVLGPVSAPYLLVSVPKGVPAQKLLTREVYTP